MMNNKLGDGSGMGEMALIASQNWVTAFSSRVHGEDLSCQSEAL